MAAPRRTSVATAFWPCGNWLRWENHPSLCLIRRLSPIFPVCARCFRQFNASVCIVITYDRNLDVSDDTPFDCGADASTLVNAAWSRGLGAVINSQSIMQSPVVREHARIPDDQIIMKSIELGWPGHDLPANAIVSERKRLQDAAVVIGFRDLRLGGAIELNGARPSTPTGEAADQRGRL